MEPNTGETTEAATGNTSTNSIKTKAAESSAQSLESAATEDDGSNNGRGYDTLTFLKLWKFEVLSMIWRLSSTTKATMSGSCATAASPRTMYPECNRRPQMNSRSVIRRDGYIEQQCNVT